MAPSAASSAGLDWYLQSSIVNEPEYIGSTMVFYQASAPVGWTQNTSFNDCTLRLVSGLTGGSSGGSTDFTTIYPASPVSSPGTFAAIPGGTTTAVSIGASQYPVHTHGDAGFGRGFTRYTPPWPSAITVKGDYFAFQFNPVAARYFGASNNQAGWFTQQFPAPPFPSLAGVVGPASHSHTYPATPSGTYTATQNRAIKYVNVIICTKD